MTTPSLPSFVLPAGAVDAHVHVFGPAARFPFAPERTYTPDDASCAQLLALQARLGFSRTVIVQATCHGTDNSAMLDACRVAGERARGVAVVDPDVPDSTLRALHAGGVRGVRLVLLPRLLDGAVSLPRWQALAARMAPLGWHMQVYFELHQLPSLWDFLMTLPTPVVIDHMGRPDVTRPLDDAHFVLLQRLLRERAGTWIKVSCPERLSVSGPWAIGDEPQPYQDVLPFARCLVASFPDQVLWGTDWPHPNMHTHTPDDARLVDWIPQIACTPALQHKLLVDNPARLYWSD